mmetsp:Transcript_21655/g.38885  ORF Transcript_21655/g.38885 Transcript_21655/m.38885 type:complete len:83 (+) Transcript_21655:3-251(+)
MVPLDPTRSPRVVPRPFHSVGLWVDDLPAAVSSLTAAGIRLHDQGIRTDPQGRTYAYIHPKPAAPAHPLSGEGVLVRLVQGP